MEQRLMDRYKIERRGGPDNWGPFQIVDNVVGSNKPIAVADDGEIAQLIVDRLNLSEEMVSDALKLEDIRAGRRS